DSAVVGEPSAWTLRRGHRGRTGIEVTITGRAGHASAPDQAINPHPVAAAFLVALGDLRLPSHPEFGPASLVPTIYRSDNDSVNVIPESVRIHLDWRTIPGEEAEAMVQTLQGLLDAALTPGSRGKVAVVEEDLTSYSGLRMALPAIFRPYALAAEYGGEGHAQAAVAGQILLHYRDLPPAPRRQGRVQQPLQCLDHRLRLFTRDSAPIEVNADAFGNHVHAVVIRAVNGGNQAGGAKLRMRWEAEIAERHQESRRHGMRIDRLIRGAGVP